MPDHSKVGFNRVRFGRGPAVSALLAFLLLTVAAEARSALGKLDQAREYYDKAREAHASLVLTPPEKRTEKNYADLIEDFRRVYLTAPTYGNDTICLMVVGELAEEAARRFLQPHYFQTAIDSYEFLLKEYPQSQFRFEALLSVARIYRQDLGQPAKALEQYKRYLKTFPNSAQSKQVEVEIARLRDELGDPSATASEKAPETAGKTTATQAAAAGTGPEPRAVNINAASALDKPADISSGKSPNKTGDKKDSVAASPAALTPSASASPVTISGVRFWKTSDYSRVVLETGQKVKYEVGRATSPDRLYLDLYDTKVAPGSAKPIVVDDGLLKSIRMGQYKTGISRVVLDLADKTEFVVSELTNPYRLVIDVHAVSAGATPPAVAPGDSAAGGKEAAKTEKVPDKENVPAGLPASAASKAQPDIPAPAVISAAAAASASGAVNTVSITPQDKSSSKPGIAAKPDATQVAKAVPPAAASDKTPEKIKAADPISGSGQTLTRALGLKIGRILIDPGHGGHDTGTIGPSGYTEKELVLDVSQRLGRLIEDRLGSEVSFTRDDDTFVPLEERAEMANNLQADLFISIHANSSNARSASGIETYYLALTADPEALEVAARENAVSQETISELQGLVRKIALNEKVDESKEFASRVQAALGKSLAKGKTARFNRGVKKAPFVVLIGANMPAILAEISFLSNPEEEKKLKTPEQRQKIAEALYAGVSSYAGTLSGVKPSVKAVRNDKQELEKPAAASTRADKAQPTQTASLQ